MVGLVARLGEEAIAKAVFKGVVDFAAPAFLVTLARSVSVVMTNTKMIGAVPHAMEGLVSGASSVGFVVLTIARLPLSFLVGGGSAGTALTMPVLAPLGDFAGVDRALVITARSAAAGWLRLVAAPTNAILVAGLALARVGYDQYLRFVTPHWDSARRDDAVPLFGALL